MELVILIGVQASGKSTFFQRRFRDTHVRINLDMLKTRHRESLLLKACIEMKQPFVVDNTNPAIADRSRYIAQAVAADFRVSGFYFESKIETTLKRNAKRSGKQRIPDEGIRSTYSQLVLPSMSEGFSQLNYVRIAPDGIFQVEDWVDEV